MKDIRNSADRPEGYFLYHSIGMYPGKEEDLAQCMADFAGVYGAPNDRQWGYMLRKRQDFVDYWRHIIGAVKGSVTACDSVTQGVHAVVTAMSPDRLKGKRVLIAEDCFPSVHFLLTGLAPRLGYTLHTVPKREGAAWVEDDDFIDAWGPDVGLALLTWVTSTASYRCDLDRLAAHGREMGSLIGVDITQAAGLIPFDVMAPRIDFAVSTSLKWMCGTPGAGIIYVDKPLIPEFEPELRGWFSQNNPFSWALDKFEYAPDIRRFDSGTPASMAAIASVPALKWHAAQDREAMLRHNRALVDRIIDRADALGLPLLSPRAAEKRGGSVMMRMPSKAEAGAVTGALGVEGISVDFRDAIFRMSPGVLTEADEVERAFDLAASTMERRRWRFAGHLPEPQDTADPQATVQTLARKLVQGTIRVADCTAPLGPDTPILRLPEGFAVDTPKVEIHKISEYDSDGPFFAWNWLKLGEHSGTHFDAPHHWLSGKDFPDGYTDTLDVQRLIAPVNVIDCSAASAADPDFLLDVDHVKDWETEYGEIRPGEWVVMRSDWDAHADDEERFLNDDPDPMEDGSHSPGPTAQCIDYLLSKGIVGWGSQCIGTDAGMAGKFSPPYPAHSYLHRDNCFGLASLANLDALPPKGAVMIAGPLKIARGTGSPVRALALVPNTGDHDMADTTLTDLGALLASGGVEVVDCSGTLGPDTPILQLPPDFAKNTPKVEIHKISEYDSDGPFFAWNWLKLGEHSGTHFDAPHHWVTGKDHADGFTDTLDVARTVAPVNVIDCSAQAAEDPDFLLTADHVREWEAEHGEIGRGEWVVMRTDWDARADDEAAFLNADDTGPHSPGPTPDCIRYLVGKGIVGWGSQCIGTDAGQAGGMEPPFPAHNLLHAANCFGLASLAGLDRLPPKGAILIAAPLKIERGTGSPVRAMALVPRA